MGLVRNGMRKRASRKMVGLMGVGRGHLILRAQGAMKMLILRAVWCCDKGEGSELMGGIKQRTWGVKGWALYIGREGMVRGLSSGVSTTRTVDESRASVTP
jgi:hypothetical protein